MKIKITPKNVQKDTKEDSSNDDNSDVDYDKEIKGIEFESDSNDDQLKGGLADGKSISDIAKKHGVEVSKVKEQLVSGIKVEMEHTDDPSKATEIAMDHLMESPEYYSKLAEMESTFDNE